MNADQRSYARMRRGWEVVLAVGALVSVLIGAIGGEKSYGLVRWVAIALIFVVLLCAAGVRSMPGNPYDGHTLAEALEQVTILAERAPKTVVVDKGYRGVEIDGVRILRSGQKRGITRTLKAMIKRRSAIEPTIGHMKMDGRLGRNPLKGALGDALHAVLCGAGHNLRLLIRKLRTSFRP